MRYEEFLESFLASDKSLKETIKKVSGLEGKMQKDSVKGDIKSLLKNLDALKNAVSSLNNYYLNQEGKMLFLLLKRL